MKDQEALIIEAGKVFIPLSKFKGGMDWLQEQSQTIMESEGHNRKMLCSSWGSAIFFSEKNLYATGTAIYHSGFAFEAKIINVKNTFQKGRLV